MTLQTMIPVYTLTDDTAITISFCTLTDDTANNNSRLHTHQPR